MRGDIVSLVDHELQRLLDLYFVADGQDILISPFVDLALLNGQILVEPELTDLALAEYLNHDRELIQTSRRKEFVGVDQRRLTRFQIANGNAEPAGLSAKRRIE